MARCDDNVPINASDIDSGLQFVHQVSAPMQTKRAPVQTIQTKHYGSIS